MKQKAKKYINSLYIDYGDLNYKAEEQIKQAFIDGMNQQLILSGVSKSFTYRDITDVAEDLANDYCNDVTDPVWRDIRQDGIKAIQAFISKHL